jgi:hypothetical protein
VIPGTGDVAVANSFVITISTSVTCSEVRNDTTGSATAGGRFALSSGVTLTANVIAGGTGGATACVGLASGDANIVGDVYAGTGCIGVRNSGTGTLTIIGTAVGNGYGPGSTGITASIYAVRSDVGTVRVQKTQQGVLGMPAITGLMQFISASQASAKVRATSGYTEVTLRNPAAVCPIVEDVKAGVAYAESTKTGVAQPNRNTFNMQTPMASVLTVIP